MVQFGVEKKLESVTWFTYIATVLFVTWKCFQILGYASIHSLKGSKKAYTYLLQRHAPGSAPIPAMTNIINMHDCDLQVLLSKSFTFA